MAGQLVFQTTRVTWTKFAHALFRIVVTNMKKMSQLTTCTLISVCSNSTFNVGAVQYFNMPIKLLFD